MSAEERKKKEEELFEITKAAIGEEKAGDFLAAFGLGPKYKPPIPETHHCKNCYRQNAYWKEIHPDVPGMNEMVIYCPDCGHQESQ